MAEPQDQSAGADTSPDDLAAELAATKDALAATKKELAAVQAKWRKNTDLLKGYEDDDGNLFDPDAVRDALAKVDEMANWTPSEKVKQQLEAAQKQLTDKHAKELQKLQDRIGVLNRGLHENVVDRTAVDAISQHKANVRLLRPHVMAVLKMEEDGGKFVARVIDPDTGNPMLSGRTGDNGAMKPDEYVNTVLREQFPEAFPGTEASGSGARGAGASGVVNGAYRISARDATDPAKYRAAKAAAEKAGADLQFTD